jgi:hypothetical protein
MKKTVAIVGSHYKTRELAPYQNNNIDIWVCNSDVTRPWCKRQTAVFEIHPPGEYAVLDADYWKWLQENKTVRVIMNDIDPRVPMSEKYPLEKICNKFLYRFWRGKKRNRYFTTTVAYAIALAIYQGYERIELYGVELEVGTEYVYQRDSVGLWVGIALGQGVEFWEPETCILFDAPLYGYDDDLTMLDRRDFEEERTMIVEELIKAQKAADTASGKVRSVLERVEAAKKRNDVPQKIFEALGQEYDRALNAFVQANYFYGTLEGQLAAVDRWIDRINKRMISMGRGQEVQALTMPKKVIKR